MCRRFGLKAGLNSLFSILLCAETHIHIDIIAFFSENCKRFFTNCKDSTKCIFLLHGV